MREVMLRNSWPSGGGLYHCRRGCAIIWIGLAGGQDRMDVRPYVDRYVRRESR